MTKQIYVNLAVSDLEKSTAFYEALGFVKNPMFSDENASGLAWSDEIYLMILKRDFYKRFLRDKTIADPKTTSGVLLAISMDSKDDVRKFADTAKEQGGDFFQVDNGISEDMMFGFEVLDPDGYQWEALWMNSDFNPQP
ncbi:MAG: Glyoxalase family protein [Candidatus Saccharibacteria bacterium]|nr:Glyoxalase family protein [Candidatus Saccharibacteria bacterium]